MPPSLSLQLFKIELLVVILSAPVCKDGLISSWVWKDEPVLLKMSFALVRDFYYVADGGITSLSLERILKRPSSCVVLNTAVFEGITCV